MRYFCTSLGTDNLTRGLALYESLRAQAGDFELVILCADPAAESALRSRALPCVRLLSAGELTRRHPPLAAAQSDRTAAEFFLTCTAWLLRDQLPQVPAGVLLTYLAAEQFFFRSPQPAFDAIGTASVAITPQRLPAALANLERRGKFNAGWVTLRHDATGLACAADWADQCAAWCFTLVEPRRHAEQKYLDAWPAQFPGTVVLSHPGVNAAPWSLAGAAVTASPGGPLIGGQPLVCFQFHGLHHLVGQLYDPGLHQYDVAPSEALREHLYRPYLRVLAGPSPDGVPDIVPPALADDPRAGVALPFLVEQLRAARRESADHQLARAKTEVAARQSLAESRDTLALTLLRLKEVEDDRFTQRLRLLKVEQDLKQAYFDLEGNVEYIKKLLAETAAERAGKDAQIASLSGELERRAITAAQAEQEEVRTVLEPYGRRVRRLLVAKFHPRLLSEILWFPFFGATVDVFGCPPDLLLLSHGAVRFHAEPMLEWLGQLDSLFSERAYRAEHPDVQAAIAQGALTSGWDHFLRFGQREGRSLGSPAYCSGLAEFDAVAFDGSDAGLIAPFLAGRMQPYQQLFISGFTPPTDWFPAGEGRSYLLGHTLHCEHPPAFWIGPREPAGTLASALPPVTTEELFPEKPAQRADWPRITVVTASHNQAAHLEETLRSVLDQCYPNLEYIVIDGGSTDGSADIIKRYADRLVWRVGTQADHHARALNEGLALASGRILTWLDCGDRLAPGSLFTVGQNFLLHTADLMSGRCARDRDGEPRPHQLHRNHLPLDRIQPLWLGELLDLDRGWLQRPFFRQPEVFFTRDIFERAGGHLREDLRFSTDYDLWVRMAKAGARHFALPEILALSREIPGDPADAERVAELRAVSASHQPKP